MFVPDKNILPEDAPNSFHLKAAAHFSSSVSKDTQNSYATGARVFLAAQETLGRPFSLPPSPSERVFLVTFMLTKNLSAPTIRSYLSAIRFYLLSKGVLSTDKLPEFAEHLIQERFQTI